MIAIKLNRYEWWLRVLFALALSGVLVFSLLPVEHPDFSSNDKINHLLAYGVLSILGLLAFRAGQWVIIGVFCWGILIELLQGMTAYRVFSVADMLANGVGVLLGSGLIAVMDRWYPGKP